MTFFDAVAEGIAESENVSHFSWNNNFPWHDNFVKQTIQKCENDAKEAAEETAMRTLVLDTTNWFDQTIRLHKSNDPKVFALGNFVIELGTGRNWRYLAHSPIGVVFESGTLVECIEIECNDDNNIDYAIGFVQVESKKIVATLSFLEEKESKDCVHLRFTEYYAPAQAEQAEIDLQLARKKRFQERLKL
jgi:hypothetical protein